MIDLNDVSENFRKTIEKDLVKIEYQKKIPEGWREVRLGGLIKLSPTAQKFSDDTLVSFLGMADISEEGKIINRNIWQTVGRIVKK